MKVKIDWGRQGTNILYYDKDGDLKKDLPEPVNVTREWEVFRDEIIGLDNLINIFAVLEEDEEIVAGNLILKRIS